MSQMEVIEKAFVDARDALAKARESHTGSWWNASVLRKRGSLIAALHDAVRSDVRHVDLADFLDGSGAYDTAEEEAENHERDQEAVATLRPLIKVLVSAGIAISGLETYYISKEDIEEVLRTRGVQEGVEASISAQAESLFHALDHERIRMATDSALIGDRAERRQMALNEIEHQLGERGVISWKRSDVAQESNAVYPHAVPATAGSSPNVAPYIVVSLPDGYNGHTLNFVGEPVERDGNIVKLRCAARGREHLMRWIDEADLQAAIVAQIASAKAWEYRDEQEGVEFLSLDRLPPEKRDQWTSERPLEAVPASLIGLDAGALDQPRHSSAMHLITLAGESPQKMRALAELLLVKRGSMLFGRVAASRDGEDALKAMGVHVGGYDEDAGSFLVCIDPQTLDRNAASASDVDLSKLYVRNSSRLGADDYPASVDEIDAEIAWCEFTLKAQDAGLTWEDRVDLESALFSLRWDRLERLTGGSPIPVSVVASHARQPGESTAKGLLLSGGRVVVHDPSSSKDAQIDISQIVLSSGEQLPKGWREIGVEEVTRSDYRALDERRQALELSFARGEDLPDTVDLHERIVHVMDRSPWMIDNDTGEVADRAALLSNLKPRMRP
ncbi:hypothetical protein [Burkholderia cepacia]|uniref:Uncharacterized protein n=1 Tax=Burkholderia cepacia TaxID=292 RepID=A0AAX2RBJ2_BURCE|nr:hypothetical protein [Burkholderia cepacia]TES96155.1 hypothetical protein E3D36_36530 [Burkholderia cepacia]TEU32931.1 hypothetical protein E3D37_41935 [Burkholderia cepacia]TEU36183.1 hypothetical protein E3D38_41070 [Burkholderia cepacia]TEU85076.1 hypothetical protein E3D40_42195 [Burkholderia cepacia]TEU95261.1 hypothetical protein E3D44_42855 [Burkholderia cepacia]